MNAAALPSQALDPSNMEIARQIAAAALVLGALLAVVWRARGRAGVLRGWLPAARPARRLECLERVTLSPRHSLHLVRAGDRLMVVAAHASGCSFLDLGSAAAAPAGTAGQPPAARAAHGGGR